MRHSRSPRRRPRLLPTPRRRPTLPRRSTLLLAIAVLTAGAVPGGAPTAAAQSAPEEAPALLRPAAPVVVTFEADDTSSSTPRAVAAKQPAAANAPTTSSAPLADAGAGAGGRLLALEPAEPIALSFKHDLRYDPRVPRLEVLSSDWRLRRLKVRLAGGRAELAGFGGLAAGSGAAVTRDASLATTLTLERVNVRVLLTRLGVPRAEEIEAIVSGRLGVAVRDGEWHELSIELHAEPGSVALSRPMLRQILGAGFLDDAEGSRIDRALDHFFGARTMIPLEGMTLTGALGGQRLELKIPLRNRALDILFEPRIERDLLWELWAWLKRAGAEDWKGVHRIRQQ